MRIYLKGEELTRHKDRPSCEISGTLCIDDNDWPIYLEPDKKKENIQTQDISLGLQRVKLCI